MLYSESSLKLRLLFYLCEVYMKINFSTLVRTNLGFPSEWVGKTEDDKEVKISYRRGETKVYVQDILYATLSLDQFDLGGYMEDTTLMQLLKDNNLL